MTNMPMQEIKMLPHVSFMQESLPEVVTWEVGEEYYLVVRVEMVGKENSEWVESDNPADKKKMTGNFKVKAVDAIQGNTVDMGKMRQQYNDDLHSGIMEKAARGDY